MTPLPAPPKFPRPVIIRGHGAWCKVRVALFLAWRPSSEAPSFDRLVRLSLGHGESKSLELC
jgi:hypothetical protein